jgi:hypothetical protein
VAPLRLGGLRGKQSTPSVWLGGTGEPSAVGERERQGARDAARSNSAGQRLRVIRHQIQVRNTLFKQKKKNVELHMIEIMMDEFN